MLGKRLAAGVQVAALAERDQLLDDRPQLLRLGQVVMICSCLISAAAMLREHRLAVGGGAAELPAGIP